MAAACALDELWHPASATALERALHPAGHGPNSSSLLRPQAAVVAVAYLAENYFLFVKLENLRIFQLYFFTGRGRSGKRHIACAGSLREHPRGRPPCAAAHIILQSKTSSAPADLMPQAHHFHGKGPQRQTAYCLRWLPAGASARQAPMRRSAHHFAKQNIICASRPHATGTSCRFVNDALHSGSRSLIPIFSKKS
mgnify:CR=1 FL=1